MDLITHFIVPYAILTLVKSRHKLEGAFGGISLDFDTLIAWIGILSPELFIFSHRGITHSFIFGFATSVIFLYVLSRKQVNGFISRIIHRNIKVSSRASILTPSASSRSLRTTFLGSSRPTSERYQVTTSPPSTPPVLFVYSLGAHHADLSLHTAVDPTIQAITNGALLRNLVVSHKS